MAFGPGKAGVFKLDNGAGSLVDISAYLTKVDEKFTQAAYDTTTLGSTAKSFIPGLTESDISFDGIWDPTVDAVIATDIGKSTTTSFEYYPAGTGTGNVKYNGECVVTGYDGPKNDVNGNVTLSGNAKVTGAVTRTVL